MELPPVPGVHVLNNPNGQVDPRARDPFANDGECPAPGVSAAGAGPSKVGSAFPAHLQADSDRTRAIRAFPSVVYCAPDDPSKPDSRMIFIDFKKLGRARPANAQPTMGYGYRQQPVFDPDRIRKQAAALNSTPPGVINGSDCDIEDIPTPAAPVKHAAHSLTSPLDTLPSYNQAGQARDTRLLNTPMAHGPEGEILGKVPPGQRMDQIHKTQWDVQAKAMHVSDVARKTNNLSGVIWANPKVATIAQAWGLTKQAFDKPGLWEDPETSPLLLNLVLFRYLGQEWIHWEPETLWEQLRLYGMPQISQVNKDKIQAIKTLLTAPFFWEDWGTFEKITLALNGYHVVFGITQDVTVAQMARAVLISRTIAQKPFATEIAKYVAIKAKENEGLVLLPAPLSFAQPELHALQPQLAAFEAQLSMAYTNRWPVTPGAEDAFSNQLAALYQIDTYLSSH